MKPTRDRIEPTRERLPERELQALREVGRTEISRPMGALLAALFALTLVAVPLARPWAGAGEAALAPFTEWATGMPGPEAAPSGPPLFSANRRLIAGLRTFEDRLERASWPRRRHACRTALRHGVRRNLDMKMPNSDGRRSLLTARDWW